MKLLVPVRLTNPQNGRSIDTIFRIDTGADVSAVCTLIASELQAPPIGTAYIRDVEGEGIEAPVYTLYVTLGSCPIGKTNLVGLNLKGTGYGGLIGTDILGTGVLVGGKEGGWVFISSESTNPYSYAVAGGIGLLLGAGVTLLLTRK